MGRRDTDDVTIHLGNINLTNLRDILDRGANLFQRDGTILVDPVGRTGVALASFALQARDLDGGWHGPRSGASAWTTYTNKAMGKTVHLGILPALDQGRTPLFGLDDDPATIVRRLSWFHREIGVPWRMSAGVAGCALIRSLNNERGEGKQPFWGAGRRRQIGDVRIPAGDLLWERPLTVDELGRKYVHAYDLNAARLAAMNTVDLPWEDLAQTGAIPYDLEGKTAGYWQVRTDDWAAKLREDYPLYPPLINYRLIDQREGTVVLSAPVMRELCRLGINPDVIDSWTSTSERWLLTSADVINRARVSAHHAFGRGSEQFQTIQAVFRQTMGMINSEGGSIFNPVVAGHVLDQQRMTLLRHVHRVARNTDGANIPFRVHTDCLWYASDWDWADAIPVPKDPIKLGCFKPKGSWSMAQWQVMAATAKTRHA